ncbi:hypothetical protein DFH07DRAFT_777419 [Mycena maculata]|uniref:Uncharacterized protein n=1 Tax=Mycena maculata TaxID=230809 RepID=A0AAD7N339_9AGAR|nr:hypothetical protein DFH07DRAFT_777419 [Mycena maculata]
MAIHLKRWAATLQYCSGSCMSRCARRICPEKLDLFSGGSKDPSPMDVDSTTDQYSDSEFVVDCDPESESEPKDSDSDSDSELKPGSYPPHVTGLGNLCGGIFRLNLCSCGVWPIAVFARDWRTSVLPHPSRSRNIIDNICSHKFEKWRGACAAASRVTTAEQEGSDTDVNREGAGMRAGLPVRLVKMNEMKCPWWESNPQQHLRTMIEKKCSPIGTHQIVAAIDRGSPRRTSCMSAVNIENSISAARTDGYWIERKLYEMIKAQLDVWPGTRCSTNWARDPSRLKVGRGFRALYKMWLRSVEERGSVK